MTMLEEGNIFGEPTPHSGGVHRDSAEAASAYQVAVVDKAALLSGPLVSPANLNKKRADERTRTAHLLITSVRSVVAECCRGLHIPHIYAGFLSLPCHALHCIALPMVSEWYQ